MTERESRESPRIEGVFRVRYRSIDRLIMAYSRDLSKGGMFLATSHFLPINAVIRVEIELPENGGRIPVTCRVAYVRDKPADDSGKGVGMGIQFLDLEQESLTRLAQFVADHAMGRAGSGSDSPHRDRILDVLIVEDERVSREIAAQAFRARGDHVRTASDGLHGLAECLKHPPDVVLSDVQMPRMDGWQLVRLLRSRPSLCSIPILFLTHLWEESERLRGYKLGVDDFIAKPLGSEELLARVDRAVERARRPGPTLVQRKTLRGDLEQVSLGSLLSFLELDKKTGVLLLVAQGTARIYVDGGRPLKVEMDGAPPGSTQLAMIRGMLDWTSGQFEFAAQDIACSDDLRTTLTAILLDHARLKDEANE
jgi:uncharacterized protein (TIGR02266 family)